MDKVLAIRTLECDVCRRFDSIMLTKSEVQKRIKEYDEYGFGIYIVPHADHQRVVAYDEAGNYLGDLIVDNENLLEKIKDGNADLELDQELKRIELVE